MAWFGNSLPQLSTITDQISSFTKEVLTETTEEVEDPTAELQLARRKISELQSQNSHLQSEWEKVKKHSDELNERAETAEYQIATISKEYRKLLQEKDEELRRLKVDQEKLREQQRGFVGSKDGVSPQSPLKELVSSQFFTRDLVASNHGSVLSNGPRDGLEAVDLEDDRGDFHDFGDIVSSQSEINRLQSELAKVKVESQHWKTLAQQKETSLEAEMRESDMDRLKRRIEELELSLQQEMTQHQREMSGLQTVQNERINSLTQRHHHEVDQLQSKIDELGRASGSISIPASSPHSGESGGEEVVAWKARCTELEEEVSKLKKKLSDMERSRVQSSERDQAKEAHLRQLSAENLRLKQINNQLESQLKGEQAAATKLHSDIATLKEHFSREKDTELAVLEQEKVELMSKLKDMQTSISEHETVLSTLKHKHSHAQLEVEQLSGEVERLSLEVKDKERENDTLRMAVQSDSTDKEKTVVDLATVSKELCERNKLVGQLECDVGRLRDAIKERESELESQKRLAKEAIEREAVLKREYAKLEQTHSCEVDHLRLQVKDATERAESVQRETLTTSTNNSESVSRLEEELARARATFDEDKREAAQLLSEKEELLRQRQGEVTELLKKLDAATNESQHAQAEVLRLSAEKEMLCQQRHALQMEINSLSEVRGQLESRVGSLEEGGRSVEAELRGKLAAREEECIKSNKQLAKLKAHLIEVEERYTQEAVLADQRETALRQEAAGLREKLKTTSHQGAMQSEQTQQQIEAAQREVQLVMEERDDAFLQMANAQEQAKQNAAALRNLQSVLEEFQRDHSSELSQALKRSQTELASSIQESQQLKGEMEDLRAQLMEASSVAEAAAILNHELEEKEKKVAELTREVEILHSSLAEKEQELEKLCSLETDKVDKSLVKNLVLGYIHANDRKKPEVVQLIHKILKFSPEELDMALRGAEGGGWFSGIWRRQPTTPKTPPPDQGTSLSRLFVSFLESESTPTAKPHPPILPTATYGATPPGYIDPRTDPDRPSLATAPLLKPHPPLHTPSHDIASTSVTGTTRAVPEKPSPIPIPRLETAVKQVSETPDSHSTAQNKQSTSSSLFLFTPARPNSAESAGSTDPAHSSRTSQSSILRNLLSE